jgi:hypothetical protein
MSMKKKSSDAALRFTNPKVAAAFSAYPPQMRQRLMRLRTLILETAKETTGVGTLEETLKWNEPAYLTSQSKSGSTIRINQLSDPTRYAMFFNCNTNLVDSFRTLFPTAFRYQGNRAIEFSLTDKVPVNELKICIAMTLTYHRRKK